MREHVSPLTPTLSPLRGARGIECEGVPKNTLVRRAYDLGAPQ